jgi:hypothetical protein
VSTPAPGYHFPEGPQSVTETVQALPRLTGAACGEVKGGDGGPKKPPMKPAAAGARGPGNVVAGTGAVLGDDAALPTSVNAGLTGELQTDVRVLVGQALLGGGLLLLVGAGWTGLGRRGRGVRQV